MHQSDCFKSEKQNKKAVTRTPLKQMIQLRTAVEDTTTSKFNRSTKNGKQFHEHRSKLPRIRIFTGEDLLSSSPYRQKQMDDDEDDEAEKKQQEKSKLIFDFDA